eukprot:3108912-Pleurochrysis_carterae.AAC.1
MQRAWISKHCAQGGPSPPHSGAKGAPNRGDDRGCTAHATRGQTGGARACRRACRGADRRRHARTRCADSTWAA